MAKRPSFYHHLHAPRLPEREARFRYTFGLGGISIFLCLVLGITGIWKCFTTSPVGMRPIVHSNLLIYLFLLGKLIRSLHYWAAQALVVASVLHLLRVVFTGAYKLPRRFNWLLGLSALVLILFFDFTGYALRWDVDISWALIVGTNLLKSIPVIGSGLYHLIVGGSQIGGATIVRLYGWHIYGLTIFTAIIIVWHVFRVRRDGGISRENPRERIFPKISRDELVWREALAALIVLILLFVISILFPPPLGPNPNFENLQADATAPWFFVWIQQLLRYGSPLWMGVMIPLVILIVLSFVPYLIDRNSEGVGRWFNPQGRVAQILVVMIFGFILWLTIKGALL